MMRTWPALLAWGAGLLHIALGAAVVSGGHRTPTVVVLCALIVLGIAELTWGVAAMRADAAPVPRLAAAGAVLAVGMGVLALVVGGSLFAIAAASAFATAAGAFVAADIRMRARRGADAVRAPKRRHAVAIPVIVGAVLVAGIATPALASTDAGLNAIHGGGTGSHSGH